MSEEPQQPDEQEPLETPAAANDAPPTKRRGRKRRALLRLMAVLLALVAGVLVTVLTVDLGPQVRDRAEREGSNYLKRPMHIGKVVARLVPGEFEFHDLVIEGLTPSDRPFLVAKKIAVRLPWWTAFSRRLIIESVTMTDWEMVIETFPSSPQYPNGRHNLPKFTPDPKPPGGKPVDFTTTLRSVLATQGQADLRGSWDAMGHRGTEPHGADVSEPADERLPRARVVLARHRGHPVVSAVPRGHAVAVQHERDEGPLRSDGPGDRRRAVDRHRRSGLQTLARTAVSGAIAHRFSDPEEHLLSRAELQRVRRRRLHRHVPSLQGRPRAEGQLRQRCGRRQRLALSEAARRRLVGAGSSRDHERAE